MSLVRKNVLDTPKIVKLIDSHLNSNEIVLFALSNRRVFLTVMLALWEYVNVSRLFKLLPSIEHTETKEKATSKQLTENDLPRFNVYTLWIKRLNARENLKPGRESFASFCRYFPSRVPLPNLTTFKWSLRELDPVCFTIVSRWPSLKSLELSLDPYRSNITLPDLPDSAFPSLTHLSIEWIPDSGTFRKFWAVPALVGKLTSVNLMPSGDKCREEARSSRVLLPVLQAVAEKSPKVEHFRLRAIDPDACRAWYNLPISGLEALQKLPLRTLWIEAVELSEPPPDTDDGKEEGMATKRKDKAQQQGGDDEEDEEDQDEDDDEDDDCLPRCLNIGERLSTMFPDIVELGFPRHTTPLPEIETFHSRLPRLETLRFDFDLRDVSKLKFDLSSVPRQRKAAPFTVEANFLGLDESIQIDGISGFKHTDAIRFAQYLFSLRPNVRIVELPADEEDGDDWPVREKMVALVNEYLKCLARRNLNPATKYEDIDVWTEKSWRACNERGATLVTS
ncbi:hypothetical protein RhiJN_03598 [Ceratobasidium sp. AG-Ba]|nr:hypothetical protein RhiJN_03598 [Ceratobasidium sp. AG-Ba]